MSTKKPNPFESQPQTFGVSFSNPSFIRVPSVAKPNREPTHACKPTQCRHCSRSSREVRSSVNSHGPNIFIQIGHVRCLFSEIAFKPSNKRVNDSELNHWCKVLYESKSAGLILYGRALGLSHSEAEDVLQETFVALLAMERRPEQPERYCLRAFRNRAVNYRRSLWRRLARELESKCWFEVSAEAGENEIAAMRCLEKLPAEQREVIVLKIWHGFTFEEIGEVLETS